MSPLSINFSSVSGMADEIILVTFDAKLDLHSNEGQMPEILPQMMNTQEILDRQKEQKRQRNIEENLRRKHNLEKSKDEIKDTSVDYNLKVAVDSNANTLKTIKEQPMASTNNNTFNEQFLKQNMDFFNTVKTDLNDNRLIDMQRENDALRDHNQTLVAQLAEKDSMVKMYLQKLESLSEQFTRLEGKINSSTVAMQQNLTP